MAEKPVYGGHDYDFVQEVSDRLNCQICTKVLRDPHLAVCCGQHFCESCLNKWFTRQGKESCPHCRAEGEAFHHVIDKGVKSEINQLKIRCSNHGEGCQWTGEMGDLEKHLESANGCGYVLVACPNKCYTYSGGDIMEIKRKDVFKHLTRFCYFRPYSCEFCGLIDTYQAITGNSIDHRSFSQCENDYFGHKAECPEAPLTCLNKCGSKKIKRKDMVSHRSQCPQEPVECPFAEAGCNIVVCRHQLEGHMTSSLQQHLLLVMKDCNTTKTELHDMKVQFRETKIQLDETKSKLDVTRSNLNKAEAKLSIAEEYISWLSRLQNDGDFVRVQMPNFSEYRHSGKVWHSPPFYYKKRLQDVSGSVCQWSGGGSWYSCLCSNTSSQGRV